jgi:hypothetical protein
LPLDAGAEQHEIGWASHAANLHQRQAFVFARRDVSADFRGVLKNGRFRRDVDGFRYLAHLKGDVEADVGLGGQDEILTLSGPKTDFGNAQAVGAYRE